jgi:predicted ATPase
MSRSNGATGDSPKTLQAITSLSVSGFKSIVKKQTLEIRPLTLLAGANNSGKSSMMQPLLLLKQTLEAPYDPGPLLLNGPNVRFSSGRQLFSKASNQDADAPFVLALETSNEARFETAFRWDARASRIELIKNVLVYRKKSFTLTPDTRFQDVLSYVKKEASPDLLKAIQPYVRNAGERIGRNRFRLTLGYPADAVLYVSFSPQDQPFDALTRRVSEVIHLPGLRGDPRRTYPVATTAWGDTFPGTFENYVASLIVSWTVELAGRIGELSEDLEFLGLTWKIQATPVKDTEVELRVGRLSHPGKGRGNDLVSIADMGFGVSQALPVVVALRAARLGQLVYIEQPEIHLHPRAQVAMARLLVNAANRGVRVVAETHSSLILLAVQTLVAEGVIDPGLVGLNWFLRNEKDGTTRIKTAELDEAGRFGDWPEDFDEVALEAENRYLSAAEDRLAKG